MGDLRLGHDYHLAEAERVGDRWRAYCDACGWEGPIRPTKSAADDDATAHDATENK